jgi:hypothetical protein
MQTGEEKVGERVDPEGYNVDTRRKELSGYDDRTRLV